MENLREHLEQQVETFDNLFFEKQDELENKKTAILKLQLEIKSIERLVADYDVARKKYKKFLEEYDENQNK